METGYVLNPLDIIIFGVILFGMYQGSKNGLLTGLGKFAGIGLGILLGLRFRKVAETILEHYIGLNADPATMGFLSFALAFVIVYLAVNTIMGYLRKILDGDGKIGLDSALGALFGGIISAMILSVLFFLLNFANFPTAANRQGSIAYPFVKNFARVAMSLSIKTLDDINRRAKDLDPIVFPEDVNAPNSGNTPSPNIPPSDKPGPIR